MDKETEQVLATMPAGVRDQLRPVIEKIDSITMDSKAVIARTNQMIKDYKILRELAIVVCQRVGEDEFNSMMDEVAENLCGGEE